MQNFGMLGNIIRRLDQIERLLFEAHHTNKWYDPAPLIIKWDNVIPVWRYNGIYYKVKSKLLGAMGDKAWGLAAFNSITSNPDRIDELWTRGVQPEYIKFIEAINLYVCTSGDLLHKNLSILGHSTTISGMEVTFEGEEYLVDRAKSVMEEFRGEKLDEGRTMFFRDGMFGNCRIDNLLVPNSSNGQ